MNEFEAWNKILEEWKQVDKMKKFNQQLYDQLNGSILYLLEYVKKHNIIFPNRERLLRLVDNTHSITNELKEYYRSINIQNQVTYHPKINTQMEHPEKKQNPKM